MFKLFFVLEINFNFLISSDSYDWMRKFTTRNPMRSRQHIPLAFNKIEPDVLANQLTYLEWKTLRRISVRPVNQAHEIKFYSKKK